MPPWVRKERPEIVCLALVLLGALSRPAFSHGAKEPVMALHCPVRNGKIADNNSFRTEFACVASVAYETCLSCAWRYSFLSSTWAKPPFHRRSIK